ncbi:NUDIX domain-containing protein [Millisia brevis]|uniref:NUDIX domain-containing protein n=1 Tax=Millisia brevis TaxID=264148 RepID=UPI001C3F2C90|nr:NUDIX domain-containing protein [Millisia brevis]
MTDRFRVVAAVHLLLVHRDSILLLRRFNTGYEDGNYGLPAGHLDGEETVTAAIVREAREETGIRLTSQDLRTVHVMHRNIPGGGHERIDFFLTADRWEGSRG